MASEAAASAGASGSVDAGWGCEQVMTWLRDARQLPAEVLSQLVGVNGADLLKMTVAEFVAGTSLMELGGQALHRALHPAQQQQQQQQQAAAVKKAAEEAAGVEPRAKRQRLNSAAATGIGTSATAPAAAAGGGEAAIAGPGAMIGIEGPNLAGGPNQPDQVLMESSEDEDDGAPLRAAAASASPVAAAGGAVKPAAAVAAEGRGGPTWAPGTKFKECLADAAEAPPTTTLGDDPGPDASPSVDLADVGKPAPGLGWAKINASKWMSEQSQKRTNEFEQMAVESILKGWEGEKDDDSVLFTRVLPGVMLVHGHGPAFYNFVLGQSKPVKDYYGKKVAGAGAGAGKYKYEHEPDSVLSRLHQGNYCHYVNVKGGDKQVVKAVKPKSKLSNAKPKARAKLCKAWECLVKPSGTGDAKISPAFNPYIFAVRQNDQAPEGWCIVGYLRVYAALLAGSTGEVDYHTTQKRLTELFWHRSTRDKSVFLHIAFEVRKYLWVTSLPPIPGMMTMALLHVANQSDGQIAITSDSGNSRAIKLWRRAGFRLVVDRTKGGRAVESKDTKNRKFIVFVVK